MSNHKLLLPHLEYLHFSKNCIRQMQLSLYNLLLLGYLKMLKRYNLKMRLPLFFQVPLVN